MPANLFINFFRKLLLWLVNPCIPHQIMALCTQLYSSEKKALHCSIHYTAVRINNCLKRTSTIKVATMKLQTISVMNGSHHVSTTKSTLVVNKDEWDTKEHHEECIVCTAVWQKAPFGLKRHIKQQKAKNQACSLNHCWVTLVWRHRSVSRNIKFHSNFLKVF